MWLGRVGLFQLNLSKLKFVQPSLQSEVGKKTTHAKALSNSTTEQHATNQKKLPNSVELVEIAQVKVLFKC